MRRLFVRSPSHGRYGFWSWTISDDIARVRATIDHHNQQFKAGNRFVVLKSDGVSASGFPFAFHVKVTRPTLSMIYGKETFAVSLPALYLAPRNRAQGKYEVIIPNEIDALYAKDGEAPENYVVTLDKMPDILLRAQADSGECSMLPGAPPCPDVAADAPLISYAAKLPTRLTLHVTLGPESRDIGFDFMPLSIPIFAAIPTDADRPLQIFVGMLREAVVFKAK